MRSDKVFTKLLQQAEAASRIWLEDEPPAKRQRMTTQKLQDYRCEIAAPFEDSSKLTVVKLKRQYFEAIDIIKSALNERFQQPDIETLS